MNKLVCNQIYWHEGRKHLMGTVVVNLDNVKWVEVLHAHGGTYYRLQFDTNLFLHVEDLPGQNDLLALSEGSTQSSK